MNERTLKPRCGKCGSTALYRDDDDVTGVAVIACRICGTRSYGCPPLEGRPDPDDGLELRPEISKEGIAMPRIIGTCSNCERPNMRISNKKGTGICGSCKNYIAGLTGKEKEIALATAKERLQHKPKLHSGRVKKDEVEERAPIKPQSGVMDTGSRAPAPGKVEGTGITNIITLGFGPDDQTLYRSILAVAKRCRRTPDQHILWLVEAEVEMNGKLEKEAAG